MINFPLYHLNDTVSIFTLLYSPTPNHNNLHSKFYNSITRTDRPTDERTDTPFYASKNGSQLNFALPVKKMTNDHVCALKIQVSTLQRDQTLNDYAGSWKFRWFIF